jgi:hypothetical protein
LLVGVCLGTQGCRVVGFAPLPCDVDLHCPPGTACVQEQCLAVGRDAGTPEQPHDAGDAADAGDGEDAGVDGGGGDDAGIEDGGDAGPEPGPPWFDLAYAKRAQLVLTAADAPLSADYPVRIAFDHSAMVADGARSDGEDLRVALFDGASWSELPRALAAGSTWNEDRTAIFVRLPRAIALGAEERDIYLYFGSEDPPPALVERVPSARFFFARDRSDTQTTSTTYAEKLQLKVTPRDADDSWIVFATWRQRGVGGAGIDDERGRARFVVDGTAIAGVEDLSFRQSGEAPRAMSAWLVLTGSAEERRVSLQFRSHGGLLDAIDNASMVAFLVPDPARADLHFVEDRPRALDVIDPTFPLDLTFTPASAGEYVWLVNGACKEGPANNAEGLFAMDETGAIRQRARERQIRDTSDFVPFTHAEVRPLPASPVTLRIMHRPSLTPTTSAEVGSERQGLAMAAFRGDVFQSVERASDAQNTDVVSADFVSKLLLQSARQPGARDVVYLVVANVHGVAVTGALKTYMRVALDGGEQMLDEMATFNGPSFAPVAWAFANTTIAARTIEVSVRADPGQTARVAFAHALALTYKDPEVSVGAIDVQP